MGKLLWPRGGTGLIEGVGDSDFFADRSSSDVSTFPRMLGGQASQTIVSGNQYGARAVCQSDGAFTKVRFATGATLTSVTKYLVGVFDANGSRLTDTGDLSASVSGQTSHVFDNIALLNTVNLVRGQVVFLAIGGVWSAATMTGITLRSNAIAALEPILGRTAAGYVSGNMLDLTAAGGSALLPWVELIP